MQLENSVIAGIMIPDALTPGQYYDGIRADDSCARPIKRLMLAVLEDAMRFYFEFHFDQGEGYLAHLHDPLAAAVALDPGLVQYRPAAIDVELTGTLTRGMTIADWNGHWGRRPNALVGIDVDPNVFFDRFAAVVGAFAQRLG